MIRRKRLGKEIEKRAEVEARQIQSELRVEKPRIPSRKEKTVTLKT